MTPAPLSAARARWEVTHGRILASAGALFRTRGFAGASVERVMHRAGLTVGGFYAHFRSKQELLVEALRDALRARRLEWVAPLEGLEGAAWARGFVRRYLNRTHRDTPAEGCPLPALLGELGQGPAGGQRVLAEELEALAALLAPRLAAAVDAAGDAAAAAPTPRQQALATLALCVGALALARATGAGPLSDELLAAARAFSDPARR